MSAVPSTQTALLLSAPGTPFTVSTRAVPVPGAGQVLIKVHAAALNPIDAMMQKAGHLFTEWPAVAGNDGAGEVVALGEGVHEVQVGDRVLFQCWFTVDRGTFQQYAIADAARAIKFPKTITYDEAATIPLCFFTAALGYYGTYDVAVDTMQFRGIGLDIPVGEGAGKYKDEPILIPGGASSVGQFAIQLAKLSGFNPIITTCSKSNESYCLSAGATHVIDYKTVPYTSLASHITSNITSKPFKVIYDAVSTEDSQAASWSILSDTEGLGSKAGTGGKLVITLPPAKSIASELDEKQFAKNGSKSASWAYGNGNGQPTQADANKLARALEGWLIEGKIKPNKVELLPGGLSAVDSNVGRFHSGGTSGAKLVVRPFETIAPA
ncbi:GroES-like protein [Stereum hirsutum FP-91666 SS1]|uniref:GroES-like protein n=1 Tax=Stereum hirsutum (strain FP-91666) TaxID=721885 RepID=UPI000440CD6A|nr:GroES-like protein [Stereum hirsutum FP-91666 SS1]EIM91260.1 GroES-like protein [Stereum hirsutum FP-91666 SS1]